MTKVTAPVEVDFAAIRAATPAVYERRAADWDRGRTRVLFERPWLDRFAKLLPQRAKVLDLGCGAGEPIATWLDGQGFAVTGFDQSHAMLDLFRNRLPNVPAIHGDMRTLSLGTRFDGVIGWDSFFHLSREEQRKALPVIADHVARQGVLMLTVGPSESEVTGTVGGETVYHASLGPEEYSAILGRAGFEEVVIVPEDPDCDGHSILFATRAKLNGGTP